MISRVLVLTFSVLSLICSVLAPSSTLSGEGMWLPQELPATVLRDMEDKGCSLTQEDIFNAAGTGIANAVVKMGSTGSFVSPEGLILTNHHVAFGAVQRMSSAEDDYIARGFLAKTREEEVQAKGYVVYVIQSVQDVTKDVLSAAKPKMTPIERYRAIERRTKEIVRKNESNRGVYCEVRSFSGGARYLLYRFLRLRDVRVVYVPSRAIGEYGGDIDNWMWPRHTGDFSFLRAYVGPDGQPADFSKENVPYSPKKWLKLAPEGFGDGDFAMIIGFPGGSRRHLTSYALADYETFECPQYIRLDIEKASILEEHSARDREAAVKVASMLKGIRNDLKHKEGILEGFKKFGIVERQRKREAELRSRFESDPEAAKEYELLLDEFRLLYEKQAQCQMKDLLLKSLAGGRSMLSQAMLLYKWGVEKQKKDMDRDPAFMDRRIPDMKRELSVFQTQLDRGSDKALLKMHLLDIAGLPEDQRVEAVDTILGRKRGKELEEMIDVFLEGLYAGTKLDKEHERLRMFDLPFKQLMKEGDTFIDFAAKLYDENESRIEREKEFDGIAMTLTPRWIEILRKESPEEFYHDANSTMRLNYGRVEGYSPRDAVFYLPFAGLRGVAEKNTEEEPFNCPGRLLDLAAAYGSGSQGEQGPGGASRTAPALGEEKPYFDLALGDVPVNFLTTNDSTRGNSGSPVLNARGEIVGCLFDGNYEGVSHDFAFEPDITRSISVDIRYVLFITDLVDNAQNVLEELGVK